MGKKGGETRGKIGEDGTGGELKKFEGEVRGEEGGGGEGKGGG